MKLTIVIVFAFLAVSFAMNHRLKETVMAEAEVETDGLCGWLLAPCGGPLAFDCCWGTTCDTWWGALPFAGTCK